MKECPICKTTFRQTDQSDTRRCPYCHSKILKDTKPKRRYIRRKLLSLAETVGAKESSQCILVRDLLSSHITQDSLSDGIDEDIKDIYVEEISNKERQATLQWDNYSSAFAVDGAFLTCLSQLQNNILQLFYGEGLSYKQIAFRLSGNRKGSFSCEQISYQIRSAKIKLLQLLPSNKMTK
jgi:DNA-directed RNA polymerase subunit RPC12/RpoP